MIDAGSDEGLVVRSGPIALIRNPKLISSLRKNFGLYSTVMPQVPHVELRE